MDAITSGVESFRNTKNRMQIMPLLRLIPFLLLQPLLLVAGRPLEPRRDRTPKRSRVEADRRTGPRRDMEMESRASGGSWRRLAQIEANNARGQRNSCGVVPRDLFLRREYLITGVDQGIMRSIC